MLKLYKEHREFDEFTKFDTKTGKLETITESEFKKLPNEAHLDDVSVFSGETPDTRTRFPRRIYLQITRNCNLSCSYCFIKANAGGQHAPTSAIMDLADFMGENGLMEVRLTGGEPTTHPDFFSILHRFKERHVYVSLATNGVMDRRTIEALCEEKDLWLICSLDGDRATHNRYRPGTFDKIIDNLTYLRKRNDSLRMRLTTVLTKKNKSQMYELGQICANVGAESITVIPLRPQVRDPAIKKEMVTSEEFRQVIEDLVSAKEKLGIRFTTTTETDFFKEVYKDPIVRKRSSCAAGREATNIDYDAAKKEFLVYGCAYSPASDLDAHPKIRKPFLAGTFSKDRVSSFLDIWRDHSAWTIFRELSLKYSGCKQCSYLANHQCVGSCPIQNLDYKSLKINEEMLNQLKEQILHTSEWYCYKNLK